ncbi:MAG: hypothetical protein ACYCRH_03275 [Acidiferrobacteraceae bacterium]
MKKDKNAVMRGIRAIGENKDVAEIFQIPEEEVGRWIDEHFVPYHFVHELSFLTSRSVYEFQTSDYWMEIDGCYWPLSGYNAKRNEEADRMRLSFVCPARGWELIHPNGDEDE